MECCVIAGKDKFIQAVNGIVRVAANSPHAMNAKPQIIDDLWFFYF